MHTKKPLASLTGDAGYKMQTQNEWKHIPPVLVHYHGSENCSDMAFYKSCAAHIHLISYGSHEDLEFPDKHIITDMYIQQQ